MARPPDLWTLSLNCDPVKFTYDPDRPPRGSRGPCTLCPVLSALTGILTQSTGRPAVLHICGFVGRCDVQSSPQQGAEVLAGDPDVCLTEQTHALEKRLRAGSTDSTAGRESAACAPRGDLTHARSTGTDCSTEKLGAEARRNPTPVSPGRGVQRLLMRFWGLRKTGLL